MCLASSANINKREKKLQAEGWMLEYQPRQTVKTDNDSFTAKC